ncbi:hypothetical protein HRbin22_00837 [Candidatus Thermoflexus japonica]|uniref:Uncharacterized protein n=1 Tax=Candidatus Thermoflexus japonica TaxID=2035417 RepID=A0A2H5Y578_9CHLR|nr:hypothetical protein HRbin22_00837 [Candidatus Thermoflexus japonica]
MDREEQIALAQRIAQALPEVTRNEWMRWLQVVESHGLEKAIRHAEHLAQDVTMRPAIQRANRLIAQAVRSHLNTLQRLPPEERKAVLGYVSWWLRIMTLRGSQSEMW